MMRVLPSAEVVNWQVKMEMPFCIRHEERVSDALSGVGGWAILMSSYYSEARGDYPAGASVAYLAIVDEGRVEAVLEALRTRLSPKAVIVDGTTEDGLRIRVVWSEQ